jgi:3-dehydroquinate synthase
VPTTLLAQVDSSVGGKTGVNLPEGKNLVGAFHQPATVCIDPETLATLPEREYRAGFGEVVKYGMIRDAVFFDRLERNTEALLERNPDTLARVVERCLRMKREYVVADETEGKGRRVHLNYGHSFGHAVEAATRFRTYRHGEAVALGMAAASRVSVELSLLGPAERARLLRLLGRLALPTSGVRSRPEELLARLRADKKARDGRLRIVLTKGIGLATVRESVPERLLFRAFVELCAPAPRRSARKEPRR